MSLFAFTRQEGSDERNPWAIVLRQRRHRLAVLEGALALSTLFLMHIPFVDTGLRAGILGPLPAVSIGLTTVCGMLWVVLSWRTIVRSPLFLEAAITPQSTLEIAAAVHFHGRRWLIYSALVNGLAIASAGAMLALRMPPDKLLLLIAYVPLHIGVCLMAVSLVNFAMGMVMHLEASYTRLGLGERVGCGLGCGCVGLWLLPPLVAFAGALAYEATSTPPLIAPFQGELDFGIQSLWSLLWPPLIIALGLPLVAHLVWQMGDLMWRGPAQFPLTDLQAQVNEIGSTWQKGTRS